MCERVCVLVVWNCGARVVFSFCFWWLRCGFLVGNGAEAAFLRQIKNVWRCAVVIVEALICIGGSGRLVGLKR